MKKMKSSLKKSLMLLLSLVMVMTVAMPVAFAEETANVSITFADTDMENATGNGLRVTNIINSNGEHTDVEGKYIDGGIITFNFSEPMDRSTLTAENIKITLNADLVVGAPATTGYSQEKKVFYINANNDKFNSETKEWTYEHYNATENSYSISIADMCEGIMIHEVKFTSGVKTLDGRSIAEVTKKFTTGRIATTQGYEGRVLKDVAYGKNVTANKAANSVLTSYSATLDADKNAWINSNPTKIDLGGYYDIADVVLRMRPQMYYDNRFEGEVNVYYSNDPSETGATATKLGTFTIDQLYTPTQGKGKLNGDNAGGLGLSAHLGLSSNNVVRARYIFLIGTKTAATNGDLGCQASDVLVLSPVNADFGVLTAKKDGSVVESFTGAGTYVVSVSAKEYVSGSSSSYMIVAGYDVNGSITNINCAPVTLNGGILELSTNFGATTKSMKAVLIKDFAHPQMLTDALVLNSPDSPAAE